MNLNRNAFIKARKLCHLLAYCYERRDEAAVAILRRRIQKLGAEARQQ